MNTTTFFRSAPLGALVFLSSCTMSSSDYVDACSGYAVTWGNLVRVENLNSESQEHLRDGMAMQVSDSGCRVVVRFGELADAQTIDLPAGSIVVYSPDRDYVLQPYGRPTGDQGPVREPAGPPNQPTTPAEEAPSTSE